MFSPAVIMMYHMIRADTEYARIHPDPLSYQTYQQTDPWTVEVNQHPSQTWFDWVSDSG